MRHTVQELQRQIERSKISVEEFERALNSLAANAAGVETVFPKMLRLDNDNRMLEALVCVLRDRN
jgi:hypothetical protein